MMTRLCSWSPVGARKESEDADNPETAKAPVSAPILVMDAIDL